jgi:hypothetical protein
MVLAGLAQRAKALLAALVYELLVYQGAAVAAQEPLEQTA